jgi:hypothetical protein
LEKKDARSPPTPAPGYVINTGHSRENSGGEKIPADLSGETIIGTAIRSTFDCPPCHNADIAKTSSAGFLTRTPEQSNATF